MSGIINKSKTDLKTIFRSYSAAFQRGLDNQEDASEWSRIATRIPSGTLTEEFDWLGEWPSMRLWEGDRLVQGLTQKGYQITNKLYEATVGVKRTTLDDSQGESQMPRFQDAGVAARLWPNELVFEALEDNGTAYDDKSFFATDHPENGTTASNVDNGGAGPNWYLFDTSRPLKPLIFVERDAPEMQPKFSPDDDNVFWLDQYIFGVRSRGAGGYGFWQMAYRSNQSLDGTNLDAAMKSMMKRVNDRGRTLRVRPNLLVVPSELFADARDLIKTPTLSGGGANPHFQAVDVMVSPYLSNS